MLPSRKQAHGKACPYCGRQMQINHPNLEPTRDHVTPKRIGGKEIIICCRQCNGIKGHMLPDQWRSYMAANPGWWLLSRAERRARARVAHRDRGAANIHGNFVRERQGSEPMAPVVVPPSLIWMVGKTYPEITDAQIEREREAEEYSRLAAEDSKRRHPNWPDMRRFE
jgi:HNH endonuclease